MYESEREYIEGMYWESRDQLRQRLLSLVEERRRKLREEKEGGDIVTGEYLSLNADTDWHHSAAHSYPPLYNGN